MKRTLILAAVATALATQAQARDYISVVGSSTVYPFATAVAEQFGKTTDFKTPKVESTGSGGGLKLFCAGIGVEHPDATNASRRIKKSEIEKCAGNGVNDIVEVKIGYDGIVFANSRKSASIEISRKQIFLALAKDVPDPNGSETLVPNPYMKWKEPAKGRQHPEFALGTGVGAGRVHGRRRLCSIQSNRDTESWKFSGLVTERRRPEA